MGMQIFRTPIVTPAPFSDFAGYNRIFTVVEGSGLQLTIDGQSTTAPPLQSVRFAGEASVAVSLPHGPAQVLNIIYDRHRWREATGLDAPTLTIAHATADVDELSAGYTVLSPQPLPRRHGLLQFSFLDATK